MKDGDEGMEGDEMQKKEWRVRLGIVLDDPVDALLFPG